jgi:ABC-2 type transport system permease protein
LGKLAMAILFAILVLVTLLIAGLTLGHLTLDLQQVVSLIVVNIIGVLPFCALGLLIGLFIDSQGAQAVTNILYIPMLALSGMFFPLPSYFHNVAKLLPTYQLFQLNLLALRLPSEGTVFLHCLSLLVITGLLLLLSIRRLPAAG